jgi:hypothetical protein
MERALQPSVRQVATTEGSDKYRQGCRGAESHQHDDERHPQEDSRWITRSPFDGAFHQAFISDAARQSSKSVQNSLSMFRTLAAHQLERSQGLRWIETMDPNQRCGDACKENGKQESA